MAFLFADMSELLAARVQMGFTLGFHIIDASLGVGMPALMLIAEWRYLRTADEGCRDSIEHAEQLLGFPVCELFLRQSPAVYQLRLRCARGNSPYARAACSRWAGNCPEHRSLDHRFQKEGRQ